MRKGFGLCPECGEISYQEQTILSDTDREIGLNDGNATNYLCHKCWGEPSWIVPGENLYSLRIKDEELRMLDAELYEEQMAELAGAEAHLRRVWGKPRKPWALKPETNYKDQAGREYLTDKNGTLRRVNKQLSKKARRRQEAKARCAR